MWDLQFCFKFLHLQVKNPDAVRITLFGMCTHQLESQAYSQDWLCQLPEQDIQFSFLQVFHGCAGFTHAGKDHPVSITKLVVIIRNGCFYAQPFQGKID